MIILALRFVLEVLGVAALGFLGATTPSSTLVRVALGIGAPLALIVVWALVVAPKADNPLPPVVRELLGTALLLGVAVALAASGRTEWGIAFAIAVVVDQALILALHPDAAAGVGAAAARGTDR